ncbi:hypothetical protein HanRHA438_Chr09g0380731 [Helianthus annuus]|nr:hypothetical protein HanRHA438_Chr09g0380731 [Helianthus annuus]
MSPSLISLSIILFLRRIFTSLTPSMIPHINSTYSVKSRFLMLSFLNINSS